MGVIRKLTLLLLYTTWTSCVKAEIFAGSDGKVVLSPVQDGIYDLIMDESNAVVKIILFESDVDIGKITFSEPSFDITSNKENQRIQYIAETSFDYEKVTTYAFNTGDLFFTLRLTNLDDEPPSISMETCTMKENHDYTKDNATCTFTVTDKDQLNMNDMRFTVYDYDEFFGTEWTANPTDYQATGQIVTNKWLDYEKQTSYRFKLGVMDTGKNTGETNAMINVGDEPDMPPTWDQRLIYEQFDEEQAVSFDISAKDGDRDINNDILFSLDISDKYLKNLISLEDPNSKNTNKVVVKPIDRDANDYIVVSFTLKAYEELDPTSEITQTVQFYINDIDDNIPSIDAKISPDDINCGDQTITPDPDPDTITICENFNSNLNIPIEIKDIDTSINAQFSVTLESEPDGAFQLIPPTGYKSSTVNIAVTDASKLDYEAVKKGHEDFSHIKLTIITKGINNDTSTDSKVINVVLKDYNDEYPIFSEDSYGFTIAETIEKGKLIGTTPAIDFDEGDVVSYAIKGTIQSKLEINDKGEIIVKTDNAFDYDIASSYTFQVTATDSANHPTTVNVNLDLNDVNNKKPDFQVEGNAPVEEDQDKGYILPLKVIVSSSFIGADLGAKILWDKTTILKNYEVLTLTPTMKCFDLTTNKDGQSLILTFTVNQDHSPDFETFDTMNLMLQMENKNIDDAFEDNRYNEQSININVKDVNDNPPIWTSDTLERNYTIVDGAVQDSSASFIRATDIDLNEELTYSINSKDGEGRDWIRVDSSTGGLFTKQIIDCDAEKVYILNYEIKVTDKDDKHSAVDNIKIYIIDKNNKSPTANIPEPIHIEENTETGTRFYTIEYEDQDRDDPYNVLTCLIGTATPDNDNCKKGITISEKTAISVANKDLLDRETVEQCDYVLDCKDNFEGANGEISHPLQLKFTLILDDVNDNAPEMKIKEYKCLENVKKDEEAQKLEATDADIGDNGVVIISLNTVWDENENVVKDLFKIEAQSNNIGSLKALKDLQGLYGKYKLNIDLTDKGDPPLKTNLDITLTVGKYNFYGPEFVYPEENQPKVDLALHQLPKQVLTLSDNTELPNFEATYYENKRCDNKWNIEFNIDSITGPNAEDLFVITPTSSRYCIARLEVKQETTFDNLAEYTMNITARIKTEEGEEEGDAPFETWTVFNIRFYEVTDPYFEDNSLVTWSVFEDSDDNGTFTRNLKTFNGQLTPATYGSNTPNKIYYYVDENDYFNVKTKDDGKTELSVVQTTKIMYEDHNNITFNVKCSKNPEQWSNDNPKAILPIFIEVIDVNNNAPEFIIDSGGDHYIKAITTLYKSDPVLTVKAKDKDTVANRLTYSIPEETIQCPDKVSKCPFTIKSDTGAISTNFELQTTMEGFFTFNVTVEDELDENNGKSFKTSVLVRIVIIISDNILVFRFDNTAEDIYAQSEFLLQSINEVLRYSADIIYVEDDIDEKIAKVSTYFLDGDNALLASDILKKFSDVSVFRELRDKLREQNLELLNFPGTTTDEDQTAVLRAWLIGVSVVLGVLCVVLLILFIWKTKSLKSRIAKLTDTTFGSDESINKRGAVNAPNTNIFAVEGQNPVFNIEKPENHRGIDAHSIASGDSDLIGVEDNANFDIFTKEDADEYI